MKALNTHDLQVVSGGASNTASNTLSNIGTTIEHAASSVFSTSAGVVLSAAEMVNKLGGQVISVLENVNKNIAETLTSLHSRIDNTTE